MGSKNDRKLKNLFVNRTVQFRMLIISLLYMFCLVAVTLFAILAPLMVDMYHASDMNVKYMAAQVFLNTSRFLVPLVVVLFILFFVHSLYVTHRVCGPLVNFTTAFDRMSRCDFSGRVVIRKGDYLHKECDMINHMIRGVAGQLHSVKESHRRLVAELELALETVTDGEARDKLQAILRLANSESQGLNYELGRFTLAPDERE